MGQSTYHNGSSLSDGQHYIGGRLHSLIGCYVVLALRDDNDLGEQTGSEAKLRERLNSTPLTEVLGLRRGIHNMMRNDVGGIKRDQQNYVLAHLMNGELQDRLYCPRIFDPSVLLLSESVLFDKIAHYFFEANNALGQFGPWEGFYFETMNRASELAKEKINAGFKKDQLVEGVIYCMLKEYYEKNIGPMDEEEFEVMVHFFMEIDAAVGDDLLTVMYNSFKEKKRVDFELVKYYLWHQGFESFLLINDN